MKTYTDLTAAQLIDVTGMKTLYRHLENNPEIDAIIEVLGEEKDLAEIGQYMIDGNVSEYEKAIKAGRIILTRVRHIPETQAVFCLYLPPYYVFTDMKQEYI